MRPLLVAGLILAALVLVGCPHPPPPPSPDLTNPAQIANCAPTAPTSDAVCSGLFTAEGLACVRCPGVGGCLDRIDQVYCVAGTCLDDPRCRLEVADLPDAGAAGAQRRRR